MKRCKICNSPNHTWYIRCRAYRKLPREEQLRIREEHFLEEQQTRFRKIKAENDRKKRAAAEKREAAEKEKKAREEFEKKEKEKKLKEDIEKSFASEEEAAKQPKFSKSTPRLVKRPDRKTADDGYSFD
jgi:hypothetical protein